MKLIILAAGVGSRIYKNIGKSKCLIKIKGKTLIEKIILDAKSLKIFNDIYVVVGFKKNVIINTLKKHGVKFLFNKDYDKKDMLHSLKIAIKNLNDDVIVTYSDIYYSKEVLMKIDQTRKQNIILPVLNNWKKIWKIRKKNIIEDCESLKFNKKMYLKNIGEKIYSEKEPMGQYMGIIFIPKKHIKKIIYFMDKKKEDLKMHITYFLNYFVKQKNNIKCLPISCKWYEFDDYKDYKNFKNAGY